MAINDPVGDLLTRIRNGQLRGLAKVSTPASKQRARVLDVLKSEGYIRGYSEVQEKNAALHYEIELKYHEGKPVIRELTRISKPGRRVYNSVDELKPYRGGLGISIISTPHGVMSDASARENNVGGEVLCQVF
jgi:small subunit ribosomal protein S8